MPESNNHNISPALRQLPGFLICILMIMPIPGNAGQDITLSAGTKTISLVGPKETLNIGTVTFSSQGNKTGFKIKLETDKFSEHFLSMRPFKCLDGEITICHLPYPYKLRGQINPSNLKDLEHSLLFLHKRQGEYGINFWNGIYYKFQVLTDGRLEGILHETDMNELASPPAKDYDRLIGGADLVEGEPSNHRFPRIEIK